MTVLFRPTVLRDTPIARGATREEAERLAEALSASLGDDVATRQDVAELRGEVAQVRQDLAVVRTEAQSTAAQIRTEAQSTAALLRTEAQSTAAQLRAELQKMGAALREEIKGVKLWVAVGGLGLVVTAINLAALVWRSFR